MLQLFRVTNFALLENLEVEFGPGLNLLTGETGSGKSLIIDAIGLLLGERTPTDVIRSGTDFTSVEAVFVSEPTENLKQLLKTSGITYDNHEFIVRRELNSQGRSRVYINNCISTLQTLRGLAVELVDLQGQGEHHALLTPEAQRRYIDQYGGHDALVVELADLYDAMKRLLEQILNIQLNEQERARRLDMLQYQYRELEEAQLVPGEDHELEDLRHRLMNAEKLVQLAGRAYDLVYESENGLLSQSRHVLSCMGELAAIDPEAQASFDQLGNMRYTLEEVAYFLRGYLQKLEFEPGELDRIESRLATLDRLKRKYGGTLKEAIGFQEKIGKDLKELENAEETAAGLQRQFNRVREDYMILARKLSRNRRSAASRLESSILSELSQLAMDKVRFKVALETAEPDGQPDLEGTSRTGIDSVEFQVAVNPGEELRSLSRTASGGELSRIHLALRNVFTQGWADRTMIFDEIDSGVGGRVAEMIGKKLSQLARRNQVLCVTHLPQIAAQATHHFHIFKEVVGGRTFTRIKLLKGEGRVEEVARMLSGSQITATTMRHAREMLQGTP